MAEDQQQNKSGGMPPLTGEKGPGSAKMIATMGGVGLMAAILIVVTYQITFPIIQQNKTRFLEKSIFKVVPQAETKKAFTLENGQLVPLEDEDANVFKIYACYTDNHQLAGVAIPASGQGFQDVIRILYGYVPEKNAVVGMQVLESTETPGLGDKIEKDEDFLVNFKGLDVRLAKNQDRLLHPIKLVKAGQKTEPWQISAITGATISSRAIAKMIRESAEKNLPLIKDNLSNLQWEE